MVIGVKACARDGVSHRSFVGVAAIGAPFDQLPAGPLLTAKRGLEGIFFDVLRPCDQLIHAPEDVFHVCIRKQGRQLEVVAHQFHLRVGPSAAVVLCSAELTPCAAAELALTLESEFGSRAERMQWIGLVLLGLIVLYLGIQPALCAVAVKSADLRLKAYRAKTIQLSYGSMAYVDSGTGEPILVLHGICGGYDQGYNAVADSLPDKRIIAPSRFGYLGSDVPEDSSPREQAKAYAELLDTPACISSPKSLPC